MLQKKKTLIFYESFCSDKTLIYQSKLKNQCPFQYKNVEMLGRIQNFLLNKIKLVYAPLLRIIFLILFFIPDCFVPNIFAYPHSENKV